MTTPPTPQPRSAQPLPLDELFRWYGDWEPLTPATIADFMAGFDRTWWII
ncbi:MAG TPA: hypothetical protein IAA98_02535, partial [Candidatus Avipropionibacterium avicola]|nr:hypothetical protein [Candidatus Avipropionibacterium avicola]